MDRTVRQIRPHVCAYCGISERAALIRCGQCNRCFCNGRGKSSGSHIVHHMARAHHPELLHTGRSGEAVLECVSCHSRNSFTLGFIGNENGNNVVIQCRDPCNLTKQVPNVDNAKWKPLIKERHLASWLVKVPSEEAERGAVQLTAVQMDKLEELWKIDPNATLSDVEKPEEDEELEQVPLIFDDAGQYKRIFSQLIEVEAEYCKSQNEFPPEDDVTVRWDISSNGKPVAFFTLKAVDYSGAKLIIGQRVTLSNIRQQNWHGSGNIRKVPKKVGEVIGVEFNRNHVPRHVTDGYRCRILWTQCPVSHRMLKALGKFQRAPGPSVSLCIKNKLLGRDEDDFLFKIQLPERLSAPGLPELNYSQEYAVKTVLQRPFNLIQGPPGTGKTVTSATIVYHLVRQTSGPILVCAPSNVAVDHLADKINRTGLNVIRLFAVSREDMESPVTFLGLHNKIRMAEGHPEKQLKDKTSLEMEHLRTADVICCTCAGAGDKRLADMKFGSVLIDEVTQATEPECIIPIVRGVEQLILVGDQCQLGPVVMCKKAAHAGLSQSLFERLVKLEIRPIRLQVQYRMHPAISAFPSNAFYDGSLRNGVTKVERQLNGIEFLWRQRDKPILFWSTTGDEEIGSRGTSYLNRTEASNIEQLVTRFLKCGLRPDQIGIITPYESQRAYIVSYLQHRGSLDSKLYQEIEVASVDAFQGREKDVIIFSCVRSNKHQGIGFLNNPRRLNVALTRARFGLIIVGNPFVLIHNRRWHNLLLFYKEQNVIVEGELSSLKTSTMDLSMPKCHRCPDRHDHFTFDHDSFQPGVVVYFKNLDSTVPEETVRKHFASFGHITSFKVFNDEKGGPFKFGYIGYKAPDEAKKAMFAMNGHLLGNRPLIVDILPPKSGNIGQMFHPGGPDYFVPTAMAQYGPRGYLPAKHAQPSYAMCNA